MDIEKELLEYKNRSILEWRKKNNKKIELVAEAPNIEILNEIRIATAAKYFIKNKKLLFLLSTKVLIKHHDDIMTIINTV